MDEQGLTPSVPAAPVRHPLLRQLGSFAVAHFVYSVLAFHFCVWLLSLLYNWVWSLPVWIIALPFVLVLMALYIPLGLWSGRHTRAPITTPKEVVQATALEAGIAWCWAAVVIAVLSLPEDDALLSTGLFFMFPTFFLAYPSCCFVLFIAALPPIHALGDLPLPVAMAGLAIPAGLLPPLLFNLGCFWATRSKAQNEKGTAE